MKNNRGDAKRKKYEGKNTGEFTIDFNYLLLHYYKV